MQNDIPSDIYQLIEQLPIISFDDNEEFQRLLSSDAFTRIFHYWISNYSNDKILTQSETIQKISLYLYLTNQSADFLEQTDQLLYSRPVPTIKEFLNNNFYMGYTSGTIYPYWREQMEKIFAPGSSIKKAVFAGCIGCLTGDTIVDTLSGEYTMKELVNNYQDKWVLSWNTQNKQWEPDKIIDAFSTGIKDIYEITLDNGEKIRCTSNHRFLSSDNKWVSIDNGLVEGLSMMPLQQKTSRKIIFVKHIGKEEVFDLTTKNNHNFTLKSGIIAHNSGKSTIARKCMIYALYKVLCLKYPRAVFGVDNDASLASFIYSITLKNVFETNLMPFIKILESMPCFQRVQKISAFNNFDVAIPTQPIPFYIDNTNSTIHFKNNIMLVVGSQITHQTGRNIFNAFLDEVSEKGVEGGLEIINAIDSRISSRFQGSDYTFFSIVSSAKQKSSPVGEYIKSIPAYDKENIVFSPCLWEVKPDPSFQGDGRTFTVLVGNGVIPSRIIDNEEELKQIEDGTFVMQAGCEIINPPLTYRQKFEMSIDQAIQDIAGIATGGDDLVFKDTSSLEDPLLCPEIHFTADLGENTDLMKFLPSNMFETDITGKKRFKRAPFAERVCHFDLATSSGDSEAGISLLHKEYSVNPITGQNEEMYVFDFLGWVSSKIRIDLEAIQNLYAKLVTEYNCKLAYVTTDIHQGELMKQFFVNHNLSKKVGYLSVDRTIFPYDNAARLIELGRVKVGKCPYLLEQMQNVGVIKNKVDRLTKVRKDMLDSFVGSIEAAREINLTSGYKYYSETINKKNIDYNSLINTEEEILQII